MIQNRNTIESAVGIIKTLLLKQDFSREDNPELYEAYRYNPEVEEMTQFLCEQFGLDLYVYKEHLYLTAGIENAVFGFTNQDLKDEIPYVNNNPDIYTMYFVLIVLVTMFYKQSGVETNQRFVQLSDFVEKVSNKLEALVDIEDIEAVSMDLEFNFAAVAKNWQKKSNVRLSKSGEVSNSGNTSKYALIHTACDFFEKHKLIKIVRERDLAMPLDRFKGIIYNFFEDKQNKTDLLEFIESLNEEKEDLNASN